MIKRSHKQNCSLAFAADILSERWTLLIVRELLLKPCRYGQLMNNLAGMGTNLLAARLKELSELKLIEKSSNYYQLTELGKALEPAVLNLIRWGFNFSKSLSDPDYLHRPEWDLLAMKALFNSKANVNLAVCMMVTLNGDSNEHNPDQSNQKAWIYLNHGFFQFGFDQPPVSIDLHWREGLAELAKPNPENLLENPKESNALKDFLSAFDPIS